MRAVRYDQRPQEILIPDVERLMSDLDSQWLEISEERMERFEGMFQWSEETAHYYDGAAIGEGMAVADFGCGPGHQAVEFAKRVGPNGHVYALDINEEFLERTKAKANALGLSDQVSIHLLEGHAIPLPDAKLDRVVVRNTLIHVPEPEISVSEFRRILRPCGLAHMIEGDRGLIAVEPLGDREWSQIIKAAMWAWKQPTIGRELYALSKRVGFSECQIKIITAPDTSGRLLGMIRTIADYAVEGGMERDRVEASIGAIEEAVETGVYLAVSPQFIVTARV